VEVKWAGFLAVVAATSVMLTCNAIAVSTADEDPPAANPQLLRTDGEPSGLPGSPSTSEFDGSFSYSYDFEVPPGINGFQPDLELIYNSNAGIGVAGRGWRLGVPYMYEDYFYSGSERRELVTIYDGGGQPIEKRLKHDNGEFLVIRDREMYDKNGIVYEFFESLAFTYPGSGNHGESGLYLSRATAPGGNAIIYEYLQTGPEASPPNPTEGRYLYLERIRYANSNCTIQFYYSDPVHGVDRFDTMGDYSRGFKIQMDRRLKKIVCYAQGQATHWYFFDYETSPLNDDLMLTQIRRGKNAEGSEYIGQEFAYRYPVQSSADDWLAVPISLPFTLSDDSWRNSVTGDYNGDGIADVFLLDKEEPFGESACCVLLGQPNGIFHTYEFTPGAEYDLIGSHWLPPSARPYYLPGDFNGDGRTDLIHVTDRYEAYTWLSKVAGNGAFDGFDLVSAPVVGHNWILPGNVEGTVFMRLHGGDFNDDGLADLWQPKWHDPYQGGDIVGFYVMLSNGDGTFTHDFWNYGPDAWRAPVYCNPPTGFGNIVLDFNNDGRADIVSVDEVAGFYRNGQKWDDPAGDTYGWDSNEPPDFAYQHALTYLVPDGSTSCRLYYPVLGDVNGDGQADFLSVRSTALDECSHYGPGSWNRYGLQCAFGLSLFDEYWVRPQEWDQPDGCCFDHLNSMSRLLPGDFNGDGRTEFLVVKDRCNYYADDTHAQVMRWTKAEVHGHSNVPCLVPVSGCLNGDGAPLYPFGVGKLGNMLLVADFTGDGKADVFSLRKGSQSDENYLFTPIPDVYNNVLIKIRRTTENSGAWNNSALDLVQLEYKTTREYPEMSMPVVLNVVDRMFRRDGLLNTYRTTYEYEDGLYDRDREEFMGFGKVTVTNPDNSRKVTHFHQDPNRVGHPIEEQIFFPGGEPASRDTYVWTVEENGDYDAFVHLDEVVHYEYDLEAEPDPEEVATSRVTLRYDPACRNVSHMAIEDPRGVLAGYTMPLSVETEWENVGEWWWRKTSEEKWFTEYIVVGGQGGTVPQLFRALHFDYDPATGMLDRVTKGALGQPDGQTIVDYDYDAMGNRTKVLYPNGLETVTTYADFWYPTQVQSKFGTEVLLEEEYNWDHGFGSLKEHWDVNGNKTVYTCDPLGRPSTETLYMLEGPSVFGETLTTYEDDFEYHMGWSSLELETSPLITVRRRAGVDAGTGEPRYVQERTYYDLNGNTVQVDQPVTGGFPSSTRYAYDFAGRQTSVWGPSIEGPWGQGPGDPDDWDASMVSTTTYDCLGRPLTDTQTANGGTAITQHEYGVARKTVTDPEGRTTEYEFDHLGRIATVIEHGMPDGPYATRYRYAVDEEIIYVRDDLGNEYHWAYDPAGRLVEIDHPDTGVTRITYETGFDDIATITHASGKTEQRTYDALRRLDEVHWSGGLLWDYEYGANTPECHAAGTTNRLTRIQNENETRTYLAYDPNGNLRLENAQIAGESGIWFCNYGFDTLSRPTDVLFLYPGNFKVEYDYLPGTNTLQRIYSESAGREFSIDYSDFKAYGPPQNITYSNGLNTEKGYPDDSTWLQFATVRAANGTALLHHHYSYDMSGYCTQIDMHGAWPAVPESANRKYIYGYDPLGRLEHSQLWDAQNGFTHDLAVAYSPLGSILSKTKDGVTTTYTIDGACAHRPSALTRGAKQYPLQYDVDGNMVNGALIGDADHVKRRAIAYNAFNMVDRVVIAKSGGGDPDPQMERGGGQAGGTDTVVEYKYGVGGRKVRSTLNGAVECAYYSPGCEYRNGAWVHYAMLGGHRLVKIAGADVSFYHLNHQGSVAAISNESGGLLEYIEYDVWGKDLSRTGTASSEWRFTGQEFDGTTGLYDYHFRMYDPEYGFFVKPDDRDQNLYDPQTLNRYAYCRNNPVGNIDPDGHFIIPIGERTMLGPGGEEITVSTWAIWAPSSRFGFPVFLGTFEVPLSIAEVGSLALDVVGVVPGIGDLADLVQGIAALSQGHWGAAALNTAGLVPFFGDLAKLGRGAAKVMKLFDNLRALSKLRDLGRAGEAARGARFVTNAVGETQIFLHGAGRTLEVSSHAAQRITERGVSLDAVEAVISSQKPFQYLHDGVTKTGFYDPASRLFVGSVDNTITTVIPGAPPNYINNLMGAVP